jgi:hypothetical protein
MTSKSIILLWQFYKDGQLALASEFQRLSVWPRPAKAYLIDTILNDRPIPLFFFERIRSAQSGRPAYTVIDGQQRLRAIFEFLEGRFRLPESKDNRTSKKRFLDLKRSLQEQILNYDLTVEELSEYSDSDIRDMFVRMNRYLVKLSPQELRHARGQGAFHDFVERLGKLPYWKDERVFSPLQLKRMRAVEFVAELAMLLIEGPQDKKSGIDLYYGRYKNRFREADSVETRIKAYLRWVKAVFPDLPKHRYRRPVDLYGLVGALDLVSSGGRYLSRIRQDAAAVTLTKFEKRTRAKNLTGDAARYVVAASRQTDNIGPRNTRISILADLLRP